MGLFTPGAQVWYPQTSDTAEINVLMSTMASSIEEGLGARLKHQEIAVGCKLGHAKVTLSNNWTLAPMGVTGAAGTFNNGMTVTNNIVTVNTGGMYMVSAAASIMNVSGHSIKIEVRKNGSPILYDETASNPSYYQLSKGTTALNCVPGDTIAMYIADAGTITNPPATTTVDSSTFNHLTVVLVKATPL